MALAALPMANTSMGARQIGLAQKAVDAGATIDRAQRGVEQIEQDATRVHAVGVRAPAGAQVFTTLRPARSPSRRDALATSDRSDCRRARYSGVTSPVT